MKVIITGTTGMVGEGVLLECLENPEVSEVLGVSRKPAEYTHTKLKEYIVPDFMTLKEDDMNLQGYDACFFCAGVSSIGLNEAEFTRLTYDTTLHFAKAVGSKPQVTFVYVSGRGTDSTENGRLMWARVKGRTENDLMKLPFKRVFAFRPGLMKATTGQKRVLKAYKYMSWLLPIIKLIGPKSFNTLSQVGKAMINLAKNGYDKNVIEIKDIHILAH